MPRLKRNQSGVKVSQMAQACQRWQRNILKSITVACAPKLISVGASQQSSSVGWLVTSRQLQPISLRYQVLKRLSAFSKHAKQNTVIFTFLTKFDN